ncbi:beta-N-acetylglucosaminidase domain-containing protein [Marinobacter xestospongiae]|uniref:Beta-N-acetylglucosaminidase domain-containing protein n=1 Tax=Marinobacter xestospongiae TaxID=994319 RepID=A0ABU3VW25_9GAMM|nr:beta-N-acetylglucosaminidase domain-containing protein [Marinobacter xestospongiae]MDV2078469.1 beta-N-acetylglucosaminidase domain-containing protein [Marinobacter xestospongiae]
MTPPLGIIEGFYGPLWSWQERQDLVTALAPEGYQFYLYAPKADPYLRRRWQSPHPSDQAGALLAFADHCHGLGVRFGIGLSPFEIFNDFNAQAREALARKLAALDALGIDDLAILFDDMHSQTPQLAKVQAEIVHWVAERSSAERLLVCPTYYSDDPVLDRVFGQRPADYLETLGRSLDASIEVFWTGEEVCSREISPGHLQRVAAQLGRRPWLWDNYPVNDGDRMSRHLHLRAFSGRPAANAEHLAGHGINPALQPTLSCIPALTLAQSYQQGGRYQYGQAFRQAAEAVLGASLACRIHQDLLLLEDAGLSRLSVEKKTSLRSAYLQFDHPAAREVVAWLDGDYQVTDEMVQTQ